MAMLRNVQDFLAEPIFVKVTGAVFITVVIGAIILGLYLP
jgi:hypothetical protein